MSMVSGPLNNALEDVYHEFLELPRCEGCGGIGIRAPASPTCRKLLDDGNSVAIERCDLCEVYKDDLSAALTISKSARWVTCEHGGWHVVVDTSNS